MIAISSANNAQIEVIEPKEKDLQNFILENWDNILPNLTLIKAEFVLEGNVKSKTDKSGRIDILAFNPANNRLVVIELKRDFHKTIMNQAFEYGEFIETNLPAIYLQITQKYNITLPAFQQMDSQSVEIILVAKSFSETDTERAKNPKNPHPITLVKYQAFSYLATPLYVFDFVNNEALYFYKKETKNNILDFLPAIKENVKQRCLLDRQNIEKDLNEVKYAIESLEALLNNEWGGDIEILQSIEELNIKHQILRAFRDRIIKYEKEDELIVINEKIAHLYKELKAIDIALKILKDRNRRSYLIREAKLIQYQIDTLEKCKEIKE